MAYDPAQVIGDLDLGLEVRASMQGPPTRHIAILGLRREDMDRKDVDTAALDSINVATAGFLAPRPGATTRFEPLLMSSTSAAPIPAARFNALSDPATLRDGFKPTGIRYTLAARITGIVSSAYPQGAPPDQKPAAGPPIAHVAKSTVPANIVIIADTDLLMDYMWVQTRELLGQRIAQAFANNGDLVANAVDNLTGSGALISIRGRATFSRPFERVEALKRRADDRLRSKVLELQSELQQTETKLTGLQSKRNDQSSLVMTPRTGSGAQAFHRREDSCAQGAARDAARTRRRHQSAGRLAQGDQHRRRAAVGRPRRGSHPFVPSQAQASRRQPSMSRARFTLILLAALAALCGALFLNSQRNLPADARGAPLFPTLAAELETVTEVGILKGSATPAVTLHKTGGQWTVGERADYPADMAKLRGLLRALADAKITEEKTSDPANYPIIGVEDPTKAGCDGRAGRPRREGWQSCGHRGQAGRRRHLRAPPGRE